MTDGKTVREGARYATDRFGLLFGLLLVLFALTAVAESSRLVRVLLTLLVLAIITTTLRVTGTTPRRMRLIQIIATVGALATLTGGFTDDTLVSPALAIVNGLLLALGPFLLVRRIFEHDEVRVQLVIAALAAYLEIALVFAFLYAGVIETTSEPFFAQGDEGTGSVLYFSVVTMTTLGYGDLSPATDLGQSLVMIQTLFGQIFLVVLVAYLVGSLGKRRPHVRDGS
ncbi:MAG TPA: potassium channel family protein [Acidimicrobiia bacterium]|jgi:hypothetical protein|nr:potassium channel family protein [Acidimicrobiia bacterium]